MQENWAFWCRELNCIEIEKKSLPCQVSKIRQFIRKILLFSNDLPLKPAILLQFMKLWNHLTGKLGKYWTKYQYYCHNSLFSIGLILNWFHKFPYWQYWNIWFDLRKKYWLNWHWGMRFYFLLKILKLRLDFLKNLILKNIVLIQKSQHCPCLIGITTMGLLMLTFLFFLLTFCRIMEVTFSHSLPLNYYILPILLPSCHKMMHSYDWQYNLDTLVQ